MLALRFFRELYESLVIFSFLQFILTCVGGSAFIVQRFDGRQSAEASLDGRSDLPDGEQVLREQGEEQEQEQEEQEAQEREEGVWHTLTPEERKAKLKHICPWGFCLPPWKSAKQMLRVCTLGTLSYVFVGVVVPVVVLISRLFLDKSGVAYVMQVGKILLGVSSMLAINSLFELAHIFLVDLQDFSPLSKFISVKMVIFFTFWQGLVLAGLENAGFFRSFLDARHSWNTQAQIAQAVQHALICLEMFVASIAHHWAFRPDDYKSLQCRTLERSFTTGVPHETSLAMRRGFQAVDFRDIVAIALHGVAPSRFVDRDKNKEHARDDSDASSAGSASEAGSEATQ
mmetsp:Transcript_40149/g.128921  ORF Transcript_40149/g.128921 Transcript_40149/m.128921 type:complete len:343 (-) Transcript_40149:91-1119(-)